MVGSNSLAQLSLSGISLTRLSCVAPTYAAVRVCVRGQAGGCMLVIIGPRKQFSLFARAHKIIKCMSEKATNLVLAAQVV